jgi:hypothetical protein
MRNSSLSIAFPPDCPLKSWIINKWKLSPWPLCSSLSRQHSLKPLSDIHWQILIPQPDLPKPLSSMFRPTRWWKFPIQCGSIWFAILSATYSKSKNAAGLRVDNFGHLQSPVLGPATVTFYAFQFTGSHHELNSLLLHLRKHGFIVLLNLTLLTSHPPLPRFALQSPNNIAQISLATSANLKMW